MSLPSEEAQAIRAGLAALPRAENHKPGAPVEPAQILAVPMHRAALDPDRALVVGNRGMGKSFWAHALADPEARRVAAASFRGLGAIDAVLGFNASARADGPAPTPEAVADSFTEFGDADAIWRAVLARVVASRPEITLTIPQSFKEVVGWVRSHGDELEKALTKLDDTIHATGGKLVVVFDALDRLSPDWKSSRLLLTALLKRALAAESYRALRLKLFIRRDQFDDPSMFQFPDGSKIKNARVELEWNASELYALLFKRLAQSPEAKTAFDALLTRLMVGVVPETLPLDKAKALVDAMAGEFMGTDKKRGRVFSWLPLHLSDARGQVSPRTFLTAWSEAAKYTPAPTDRPVDHHGILEGVRKASEDRLTELKEDYWWIGTALKPLAGQAVPMERQTLESLWRDDHTVDSIRAEVSKGLVPVDLEAANPEAALAAALAVIGVLEVRTNGKINVPDIFRVEAQIKRRGGVKPPTHSPARS